MASNENLDQIAPSIRGKGQLIYDLFITPKLDRKIAWNHRQRYSLIRAITLKRREGQARLGALPPARSEHFGAQLMFGANRNQSNAKLSEEKYSQTFTINIYPLTHFLCPFIISSS